MSAEQIEHMKKQMTTFNRDLMRLSDVEKLSAHVTRVLGQNPGLMTLQGTNSYLLQPPSNPHAPLILIDSSSPHTAQQYVDCLLTHLFHLGLESGNRETHFESPYAEKSLDHLTPEEREQAKAKLVGLRKEDPTAQELSRTEYGPYGRWSVAAKKERRLPSIEHIIITHRHLDHVGALPLLLTTLKEHGCPPPKLWKFPNPDEAELALSERERTMTDAALWEALPQGTYTAFSPFQPLHPVMPGLMISIIDPVYRHLLKHDKDGKPKWNEVPEIARVSVRCLRTPGHTADSISLVMCEGEKGVFTGDTVLGQGTTMFTDFAAYMTSLKTLLALKPSVLYPGHGPHIPTREAATEHIATYITHRQQREDQIVALLQALAKKPDMLSEAMADFVDHVKVVKAKEAKEAHEFLSGKPYVPPKSKKAEEAKTKAQGSGDKPRLLKDIEREREEKQAAKEVEEEDDVESKEDDGKAGEDAEIVAEKEAKETARKEIIDKFPPSKALPMPILVRLLYQTDKEGTIAAASKSIEAHLKKLEGEGKVGRIKVWMVKITEGKIGEEKEEQEGWEWQWAGEVAA